MWCRQCGAQVRDGSTFCASCGCRLEPEPAEAETPAAYTPKIYFEDNGEAPQKKKRPGYTPYVLLAVVVVALLVVTFLAISGRLSREDPEDAGGAEPGQEAVVSTAEPAPDETADAAHSAAPESTPTPTPEAEAGTDYILPDSSSRYLSAADLEDLSARELGLARNEIFARHGRQFDNAELAAYFESKDWYHGTIPSDQFDSDVLSAVEKANIELIVRYENSRFGGSYF